MSHPGDLEEILAGIQSNDENSLSSTRTLLRLLQASFENRSTRLATTHFSLTPDAEMSHRALDKFFRSHINDLKLLRENTGVWLSARGVPDRDLVTRYEPATEVGDQPQPTDLGSEGKSAHMGKLSDFAQKWAHAWLEDEEQRKPQGAPAETPELTVQADSLPEAAS